MRLLLAAALAVALSAPCAALGEGEEDTAVPTMIPAGGLMFFYRSTGPMSFVSMTPKDVPADARRLGEVTGRSCQRGLSIPLAAQINATSVSGAYGDGGYKKALEQIKKDHPDLAGVYDVRNDVEVFSLLGGLYKSLCTIVTARGFALPAKP